MAEDDAVLAVEGLTVTFGGVRAVDDLAFSIAPGRLAGLIGPNGAGKTTCIDALTGFVPYDGRVTLDGVALEGVPPHHRARRGLVRTFQHVELFDDLDVLGNLEVAATRPRWWWPLADLVAPDRASARAGVGDVVDLLDLTDVLHRSPPELSEGTRKLVGVARALVGRPRVLLLDEPAAGLDVAESVELGTRLRRVVEQGVTVLLVDHDMDLLFSVCDEVHVIDTGRLLASGTPAQIQRDDRVIAAYLGAAPSPGAHA